MRVSLFLPCFNDALFPQTGVATVRVLERLGVQVDFPPGQTCCGQVHFNTGYRREARRLMWRFLEVFRDSETIVAPSASCVAMVREQYGELVQTGGHVPRAFAGHTREALSREVGELAARTFELSEFLVEELGVEEVGAVFPHSVALHPTCHSIRGIDVGEAPVRLLRAVQGVEVVELPGALECCGFGGTFAVKNADTSLAMLQDKMEGVRRSGAEVLTAVDNSCLMHIAGGLRRAGWLDEGSGNGGVRVMHLAEILARGGEE
jgi:L-lactate dehydrogenase complex protein LldE